MKNTTTTMFSIAWVWPAVLGLATCASLLACSQQAGSDTNTPSTSSDMEEVSSSSDMQQAANELTDEERSAGWRLLFDGQQLNQWRGYNRDTVPAGWTAEDGELRFVPTEGGGGDLITQEQFTDFDLQLDYLLIKGGNSGIFYLVNEVEGMPIYYNAPEYQLLDDATWAEERQEDPIHFTSSNYDLQAPEGAAPNPAGEWNTARIVKRGRQVEHYLNGVLTVRYELGSDEWQQQYENSKFSQFEGATYGQAASGHIGLQDHNEFVRFRNLKIKLPNTAE